MTIKFKCEKCGRKYGVDDAMAGKQAKCLCGNSFTVPENSDDFFVHSPTVSPHQSARYERINAMLQNERGVPVFPGPLWTYDEADVVLRDPQEVARRVFVLWAVSLRGEGISKQELWGEFLKKRDIWPYASPEEKRFLNESRPNPDEAQNLVWRLESMWILAWALGHLPALPWPDGMCDTRRLMELIAPARDDPAFVSQAKLRDKSEILDAQETTMRLHWAIRDAHLNQRRIAANLDWKNPTEMIDAAPTMAGRLIEERHYVLNWLVCFGNADWDDVDTPT